MPLICQWFCISADCRTICHLGKQGTVTSLPGLVLGLVSRWQRLVTGVGRTCWQWTEQLPSPMEVPG